MAYHCIIVPFDGSDHAQSALNAACGIAKGHDTQVHVVNVVPINIFPEVAASDPAAVVSPSYVTQKTYSELFDDTLLEIHAEGEHHGERFRTRSQPSYLRSDRASFCGRWHHRLCFRS